MNNEQLTKCVNSADKLEGERGHGYIIYEYTNLIETQKSLTASPR